MPNVETSRYAVWLLSGTVCSNPECSTAHDLRHIHNLFLINNTLYFFNVDGKLNTLPALSHLLQACLSYLSGPVLQRGAGGGVAPGPPPSF